MKKFAKVLAVLMAAVMAVTVMCVISSAATYSWTGTWKTNWGEMKLTQNGSKVTGSYTHDGGTISGTVSGNTLTGTWKEPGQVGKIKFVMSSDGKSFKGFWAYNNDEPTTSGWDGTRSTAVTYTDNTNTSTTTTNKDSMMIIYLEDGDKLQLGELVSGKTGSSVKYSSSNTKVAKVSSKGKVKALVPGTAIITAKCGNTTVKIQVVVKSED